MKSILFYIAAVLLVLLCTKVQGQTRAPVWQSVLSHPLGASTGTSVFYNAVTQDRAGNLYLTGFFWGTLTFGNQSFTHSGPITYFPDLFVAKLNAAGALYWLKTATGANLQPKGITTDSAGNCYITGSFGSQFDSTVIFDSQTIKAKGAQDIFTAKYSATGALQWVRQAGGPHTYTLATPQNFIDDTSISIATDNQGNCYISGYCSDTTYFGNITFIPPNPTGTFNPKSGFLAKYDATGTVQWVIQSAGTKIATDKQNYIYCCTKGVTKYNSSGGLEWQQIEPGTSIEANDLAVDSIGNSYITGSSTGNTSFSNGTTLGAPNAIDAFVAKYNNAGVMQWVQPLQDFSVSSPGNGYSSGKKIVSDAAGNTYITGTFSSSIITKLDTFTSQNNSFDVFAARYSPTGNLNAFAQAGGTNGDFTNGIAIDSNGDINIIGDARYANFGSHYLPGHQSFLARLRFSTISSVAEAGSKGGFSLYPNPAAGTVTIALPAFSPCAEVRLLNLTGKLVHTQKLTGDATALVLPKLPAGCYLVQVQSNKQVWHRKLVVQ